VTEITKWVLLLHVAATLAMVGLIWFVQIVHYPLFSQVGRESFCRYEMDHQRLVMWIVAPGMLTELATAVALLWLRPAGIASPSIWLGILLVASIWIVTYSVQVPQHASLAMSYDSEIQRKLVKGNWIRTAAWSARGLLVLWMLCQVISRVATNPMAAELAQIARP